MMSIENVVNPNPTLNLFEQVYTPGWWSKLRRMLRRRSCALLELGAVVSTGTVRSRYFVGRQLVPIAQIRGSESRAHDFDGAFRPCARRMAERWCGVAKAWQHGVSLPPVELIRVGEVYFVRDGHHRISVAAALGAQEIDALVTVWEVIGSMPWEQPGHATLGQDRRDASSPMQPAAVARP